MKRDIASRWAAALRSGKFKQGRGALHRGDEFCCLGVLCELAVAEGVITPGESREDDPGIRTFSYGPNEEAGVLPREVMDWANIQRAQGTIEAQGDNYYHLSAENDQGASFAQIADLIEAHVDEL